MVEVGYMTMVEVGYMHGRGRLHDCMVEVGYMHDRGRHGRGRLHAW